MCGNNCCYPCGYLVQATSSAIVGSNLAIGIPSMTISNHQRICLYNSFAVPVSATPVPVILTVGSSSTTFHLVDKRGNYIYSDQIYQNEVIPLEAATDSMLMVHQGCCLADSSVNYPNIIPAVPTSTANTAVVEPGGDC